MFHCCFPSPQGSGLKKTRSEGCFSCCRNWRRRHRRQPSSSGTRQPQRPAPDTVQELADGFTYAFNRYQTGGHQARKPVQSRSESSSEDILEVLARGPDYTTYRVRVQVHRANDAGQCESECAAELTLNLREACRMRALQEGTLEKMVVSMVPAFPRGKIPHISTFMSIHPAFSRAQLFLDQLFTRCCPLSIRSDAIQVFSTSGNMQPYNDQGDTPQDQLKKAVASVMGAWPDQIQYVGQPLLLPWFTLKQALVQGHLPASHPLGHVLSLWVELEHLEPTEAELEAAPEAPPEPQRAPEPEEGPAQGPVPGPAVPVMEPVSPPSAPGGLGPAPASPSTPGPALQQEPPAPPALIRMPTAEPAPCPAVDHPPAGTTKHLIKEEKRNILSFPPRLVAEQLTVMDAELFKRVLPHQCLDFVWSQRDKPGKEHLAPTVRATITQFNHVATCVITTCLGDPSMRARDRAKVVEHWIKVAKECRALRSFSALHAILSALQSVSVHRLKKTWGKVSRRSSATLNTLCKEDNSRASAQLSEKRPSRFATLLRTLRGTRKRPHKKCVPFLGKFLTDLKMLDTTLEDYLEGNQINLEKKEKEQKVMEKIVLLQEAANMYEIEPEEKFGAWFWALERLSEKESYILSCQLEPRS
uniref:Ras-GEF domain-containing protein n=1 Tax=Molossus molossus TaxID=27622 RepID=A0A7J8E3X8_MOLMO|nr:hypothetical protein HJG59_015532 [Molossus molossus]